ncbi:MAG: JAB domain-containing protein [Acidobacteriota bacterium]
MCSTFRRGAYRGYEIELRVHRRNHRDAVKLATPAEIFRFMRELGQCSAERMYELLLDTKQQLQGVYLVGKGGVDKCTADPREVYKAALVTTSPAFVMVHNHPSGIVEPSVDDMALTSRLYAGADLLGLSFLDSIIIGDGRYHSFHESGMMRRKVEAV